MVRAAALILVLATASAAAPALAGDHIQFDPDADRKSAVLDGYTDATNTCLHGRAEYLLMAGDQSRADIVKQITAMCTPTMRKVLVEQGGLTPRQADDGVQVMAWRALNEFIAAHGATAK